MASKSSDCKTYSELRIVDTDLNRIEAFDIVGVNLNAVNLIDNRQLSSIAALALGQRSVQTYDITVRGSPQLGADNSTLFPFHSHLASTRTIHFNQLALKTIPPDSFATPMPTYVRSDGIQWNVTLMTLSFENNSIIKVIIKFSRAVNLKIATAFEWSVQ